MNEGCNARFAGIVILLLAMVMVAGCSSTSHLDKDEYLLRKNNVILKTETVMYNKGEIRDNLSRLVIQKPNKYSGLGLFPIKLWLYNYRYDKLHALPDSSLGKNVQRPVIFDSSYVPKSVHNMRSYLINQGFFYAVIKDTVSYKNKKARLTYTIDAGSNYLVNKVTAEVDDSGIARVIREAEDNSKLKKNKVFTYSMLDEERGRLASAIKNNGYYKFTQENIRFVIDTMDKAFLKDVENPLENAINFMSAKKNRKPTIDINIVVRTKEDTVNIPYRIRNITIYPDYSGVADRKDSTMLQQMTGGILFKYRQLYVHSKVLADRVFLTPGELYEQVAHDRTIARLNELGIFQYIRVQIVENRKDSTLDCNIYLNKTKKYDFNVNYEISNGSTYTLGNSLGVSFRNKNLAKGANLLTLSLNGGIELSYYDSLGRGFIDHFALLTQYYGINGSVDFPKFLAPFSDRLFNRANQPNTIITGGSNVINRVQYFTLVNTSAYYKYNWHQNQVKTWELSPAFVNIIRLPRKTDSFKAKLARNQFLRDSYKEIFIEGENISYIYNNIERKRGRNYSRLKLTGEEAGALLGGINSLGYALNDLFKIQYAQYARFDVDAQHFFTLPHSVFAFRFFGGVGIPYGQSVVLPYVKQFYVGGPYSLRGWRIRSLGPGSYYDPKPGTLDRTGDIKLEANGEFRFPIVPLFAGTIKMNGAIFADAGNIWLARKDSTTPGGEFDFHKLASDLAADIGAGSRFEIASFLTLRLDVAMPVKRPEVTTGGGWVFNKINFKDSGWRQNNLIVNISIGYPF
ncbi:MAG: BamA/TamA family outer membrane protein [Taibaiella sp.]|nr:BamA/TamA family outer membrane protein [Taibaiella sp.]